MGEKSKLTMLMAALAAAAAVTRNAENVVLDVANGKLHEVQFSGGKTYRLGCSFGEKSDLYVSLRVYKTKAGAYVPFPDWFGVPRNAAPFPCKATHLWLGCPGKPENQPIALASGIPVQSDSSIAAVFNTLLSAMSDPEIVEEMKKAGFYYTREFPGRDTIEAICVPYALLGSPELTVLATVNQASGEVTFPIVSPGQNGRSDKLSWGPRNGWGVLFGETTTDENGIIKPKIQPHSIDGTPDPRMVNALQKAFDQALAKAEKPTAFKGQVRGASGNSASVLEALFERQAAAQASEQGVAKPSADLAPAL